MNSVVQAISALGWLPNESADALEVQRRPDAIVASSLSILVRKLAARSPGLDAVELWTSFGRLCRDKNVKRNP
eukprot:SAG11_NODE_2811_length_2947_cov_3.850720_5_plen_73_part_00